jgi:hypothetical protein
MLILYVYLNFPIDTKIQSLRQEERVPKDKRSIVIKVFKVFTGES